MRLLGRAGVAPGLATSKPHPEHKIYPGLLRGLAITRTNQVCSNDITDIRLFRKEERVQQMLAERPDQPRSVHISSAMEARTFYQPWQYEASGKACFKLIAGQCLHDNLCLGLAHLDLAAVS